MVGIGEGVHVLEHMKDKTIEGVTMISVHEDGNTLENVSTKIKLPVGKGSNGHQPLIDKLVDFASLIIMITGYDEHGDMAYKIARSAREMEKPTVGILTPDLERESLDQDSRVHRRIGSKMDCLVGVEKDTLSKFHNICPNVRKRLVRRSISNLANMAVKRGSLAVDRDVGFYATRKNLTEEVSDAVWKANLDFKRRNRRRKDIEDLFSFV